MSIAQFDDFLEICCEGIWEKEIEEIEEIEEIVKVEKVEVRFERVPEGDKWWKEALKEVEKEKEKELLHV
jgi:serine/threonine protein phosphatase PrpC